MGHTCPEIRYKVTENPFNIQMLRGYFVKRFYALARFLYRIYMTNANLQRDAVVYQLK